MKQQAEFGRHLCVGRIMANAKALKNHKARWEASVMFPVCGLLVLLGRVGGRPQGQVLRQFGSKESSSGKAVVHVRAWKAFRVEDGAAKHGAGTCPDP